MAAVSWRAPRTSPGPRSSWPRWISTSWSWREGRHRSSAASTSISIAGPCRPPTTVWRPPVRDGGRGPVRMAALDLKQGAVRALLWWRCRPSPAIGLVRGRAGGPAAPGEGPLRVAVVQLRAGLYRSAREFASRMEPFVRAAARSGARLVVFPGDNGTQLLGAVPGWAWEHEPDPEGPVPARLLRFASPYLVRAFTGIFAELARGYRVAIVAGTIREVTRDGRLVEAAYCFGPDGELLGRQERLHLTRAEAEKGFSPGSELVAMEALGSRLAGVHFELTAENVTECVGGASGVRETDLDT
ncbi:MAG: 3-deoxy-7-phosphoheptulonate synthase, partial [Firmicutes bacterium]|nr:3-deoxy-7-phosphoheptulonate synthase [Bacillota bacterium]